jgi:tetratricopeptide (TPR) repeat protein
MGNNLFRSLRVISIIIIPILFSCASTQKEKTESRDAEAYYNRGVVYDKKGQHDQAISDYSRALEINLKDALACFNRARAYYFKKEYDKAWEDIKKAQDLGYQIPSDFLEDLRKASGREK